MDVQMPVMDGFEATSAIRLQEQDTGRHLPVIRHDGARDERRRRSGLSGMAGMDGYISKPIRGRDLVELVEKHGRANSRVRSHVNGSVAAVR